eukprot:scaffold2325_cov126-Cylindrotheca_fusiformis.AAC.7
MSGSGGNEKERSRRTFEECTCSMKAEGCFFVSTRINAPSWATRTRNLATKEISGPLNWRNSSSTWSHSSVR